MSRLVFAIGARPTITAHDAEALARFLDLDNTEPSSQVSAKIRRCLHTGDEVGLDREDLEALAGLFTKAPDLLEPEFGLRGLHGEVAPSVGV